MYAWKAPPAISPEEYLAVDRAAARKSEFRRGEMYAMAGASREHNEIATNLTVAIGFRLRGASCRVYGNDLRVRVTDDAYCYPDLTVVCGEPRFADQRGDVLLNPIVVIEILSPTTEHIDRGDKFLDYQRMETVQEIVFVSPHRRLVERYERQEGGQWLCEALENENAVLTLLSCEVAIPLSEIYERVEMSPDE